MARETAGMTRTELTEFAHANGMLTPSELIALARSTAAERRLDTMPSLTSIQQAIHDAGQRMG